MSSGFTYHRHWHHYPSGRVVERVVRTDASGLVCSISRTADGTGFVEFCLATAVEHEDLFDEFETDAFGSVSCSRNEFETLYAEAVMHLKRVQA
jgi:hypothetical protein